MFNINSCQNQFNFYNYALKDEISTRKKIFSKCRPHVVAA